MRTTQKAVSKSDLIKIITKKTRRNIAYADRFMNVLVEEMIAEFLRGGRVSIKGFGTLVVIHPKPRIGNPKFSKEPISRKRVVFRMSRSLKALLNNEFPEGEK
jgi:nucleoid DNA-binding protein